MVVLGSPYIGNPAVPKMPMVCGPCGLDGSKPYRFWFIWFAHCCRAPDTEAGCGAGAGGTTAGDSGLPLSAVGSHMVSGLSAAGFHDEVRLPAPPGSRAPSCWPRTLLNASQPPPPLPTDVPTSWARDGRPERAPLI